MQRAISAHSAVPSATVSLNGTEVIGRRLGREWVRVVKYGRLPLAVRMYMWEGILRFPEITLLSGTGAVGRQLAREWISRYMHLSLMGQTYTRAAALQLRGVWRLLRSPSGMGPDG